MASSKSGVFERIELNRRRALIIGASSAAAVALSPLLGKSQDGRQHFSHAHSPLGTIKYPPEFSAFDYVNPNAAKGGTMRLARIGSFDTANTLSYPGRPPADIRMIYDRLVVASADERATYYGLLAEGIDVADDFSRLTFALHPEARWHDDRPVLAGDVAFTFETLKSEGAPFYRQAFLPLRVHVESERRVVFENDRIGDRDIVRRLATIPVHPEPQPGDDAESEFPVGSGPYRVVLFDPPRRLVLERVSDYWARDLPVNTGRWNLDRLDFEYFRDDTVALEAFQADIYDVRFEDNPTLWRTGYDRAPVETGEIRRDEALGLGVGDLSGLVFNLRRHILTDRRVRLAMALAYDFETVNRTLFSGSYLRFDSVFGESDLAAPSGPPSEAEASFFAAMARSLPPETFSSPDPLAELPPAGGRAAFSMAASLLEEAGYAVRDGRLFDPETDADVAFRVVSTNPLYERPLGWIAQAWERLGIELVQVQADPATAARLLLDRDFDLATLSWAPARLPGTAERLLWHSDLADQEGSYALSGLDNPALDAAIETLETARSEAELRTAGRTFDRVFRQLMPMLPLWRANTIRLAWWDRYGRPGAEEAGFEPSPIDRWWSEDR
ncbi:MAG: extracellular solute-binding protein [Pseudomonadota bacterium]